MGLCEGLRQGVSTTAVARRRSEGGWAGEGYLLGGLELTSRGDYGLVGELSRGCHVCWKLLTETLTVPVWLEEEHLDWGCLNLGSPRVKDGGDLGEEHSE